MVGMNFACMYSIESIASGHTALASGDADILVRRRACNLVNMSIGL